MPSLSIPYFGQLNTAELEEYYDVDIDFNGSYIQIDLNFENKTISAERLEKVKHFIDNIRIYDLNNKGYINNDYTDTEGDTVKFYLQHHLEELGTDELAALINVNSKSAEHEKLLLKKLHLVRVGLYPDSEDKFAIFDYSIGQQITNDMVVINTDENGNLNYMTIES